MKFLLIVFTIICTFSAIASKDECIEKLTLNFSVDSRAFKVNTDTIIVRGAENDHIAQSISIIRNLLDLQGCDGLSDINFGQAPLGRTKHSCRTLVRGKDLSRSCYIESDIGFFFVTRDLQTNAFIVFNRWD